MQSAGQHETLNQQGLRWKKTPTLSEMPNDQKRRANLSWEVEFNCRERTSAEKKRSEKDERGTRNYVASVFAII
jgi:hypothetical protein